MEPPSSPSPELSHPSDFQSTSIPNLTDIDSLVRCQICKDFFETPMITKCSHTFCSLCIRQALSTNGKCPTCRRDDQAANLRRNWPIQETVRVWKKLRQELLDALSKKTEPESIERSTTERVNASVQTVVSGMEALGPAAKRRIDEVENPMESPRYKTRSKRTHNGGSSSLSTPQDDHITTDEVDDERDADYNDADVVNVTPAQAAQAAKAIMVACPICSEYMLESLVFGHLDHCTGTESPAQPLASSSRHQTMPSTFRPSPKITQTLQPSRDSASMAAQRAPAKPQSQLQEPTKPSLERLSFLSYDMMKEPVLKKKLQQLGILATGSKALMKKRHMFWVDLWNANVDSDSPRPRRELIRDLETWEKSLGGRSKTSNEVMQKDFDRQGYSARNGDQFKDLVAQARESIKARAQPTIATTTPPGEDGNVPVLRMDLSSRPLVPPSAPIPAQSMMLSAASQLNATFDATKRRGSNALQYYPSSPSQEQAPSQNGSETRQVPMFQMQEQPFTDVDAEIK
jgi:E3 ubiquitin-protein ligase RAD18